MKTALGYAWLPFVLVALGYALLPFVVVLAIVGVFANPESALVVVAAALLGAYILVMDVIETQD